MSDIYKDVVAWIDAELTNSRSQYPRESEECAMSLAFAAALNFGHPEWLDDSGHWIKRAACRAVSGKQS